MVASTTDTAPSRLTAGAGPKTSTLTIRGIDADLKARIRRRAAEHDQSMEAEVRAILRDALADPEPKPSMAGTRIRAIMADLDFPGIELELPPRTMSARATPFDEYLVDE